MLNFLMDEKNDMETVATGIGHVTAGQCLGCCCFCNYQHLQLSEIISLDGEFLSLAPPPLPQFSSSLDMHSHSLPHLYQYYHYL